MPHPIPLVPGWTFWQRQAWTTFTNNGGSFTRASSVAAVADMTAWRRGATVSSAADNFNATLESPLIAVPSGCASNVTLSFDQFYSQYSFSEMVQVIVDWYDGAGTTLVQSGQLQRYQSPQSNVRAALTVPIQGAQMRVRFNFAFASTASSYFWCVLVFYQGEGRRGRKGWVGKDG